MARLQLLPRADRRIRLGHSWVFSNEVDVAATPLLGLEPGSLARIEDARGHPVGLAYVNPRALICARLLTRDVRGHIDADWFGRRIARALQLRERHYPAPFYRLIYGESDGLPGFVVDRFGERLVVQLNTAGATALREPFFAALRDALAPTGILVRNAGSTRELEGTPILDERIGDLPAEIEVHEGEMRLLAPLLEGQKTGYFFDQAENRARLARYIRPGDRCIDLFSYVGSWGVAAGLAGAASAICIDSSERAIEFARRNGERNGVAIDGRCGDALVVLAELAAQGMRADVVILDPPALVKRKRDLEPGAARYAALARAAVAVLAEGGTLISCSCSHHLPVDRLARIAYDAAREAGRPMQLLGRFAHGVDHPIHPAMPETEYLKALVLRL
uniref:SAM-dependent methyltransferase n=1 Tax=mine drainage metagenome TaxID=410659 RepID=E6PDN5_9ZZZZ